MMEKYEIGRMFVCEENDMLTAAIVFNEDYEGKVPLGTIAMGAIIDNPQRQAEFIDLMKLAANDFIRDMKGFSVNLREAFPDGLDS